MLIAMSAYIEMTEISQADNLMQPIQLLENNSKQNLEKQNDLKKTTPNKTYLFRKYILKLNTEENNILK
jgi:hypothetical protein